MTNEVSEPRRPYVWRLALQLVIAGGRYHTAAVMESTPDPTARCCRLVYRSCVGTHRSAKRSRISRLSSNVKSFHRIEITGMAVSRREERLPELLLNEIRSSRVCHNSVEQKEKAIKHLGDFAAAVSHWQWKKRKGANLECKKKKRAGHVAAAAEGGTGQKACLSFCFTCRRDDF